MRGLQLPLPTGVPHDYRYQFGARFGLAYSPDSIEDLVLPPDIETAAPSSRRSVAGSAVPYDTVRILFGMK